jgi:sugar/nucleoside kinase (ribokinase family)
MMPQVGHDAYGSMIVDELAKEGIDTSLIVRKAGITSPFTYVIVEAEGQTRTCIHTPSEGACIIRSPWCQCG